MNSMWTMKLEENKINQDCPGFNQNTESLNPKERTDS